MSSPGRSGRGGSYYLRAEVETVRQRQREWYIEEAAKLERQHVASPIPESVRREAAALGIVLNNRRWNERLGRAI